MKVGILGANGMLGAAVVDRFKYCDHDVMAFTRMQFDAALFENFDYINLEQMFIECEAVINCIGVIKPRIVDTDSEKVKQAILVNAVFPHRLAQVRNNINPDCPIFQIATDCVFSGEGGNYNEISPSDAIDVYGKTKALGEVRMVNFYNIRCSIIGPEPQHKVSFLEWFLSNPQNAEINGFTNHDWNGVTTYHFAKIVEAICDNDYWKQLPQMLHLIPRGKLCKADMVECFADCYGRDDIKINRVEAPVKIDRTLSSNYNKLNETLWELAGYKVPPSVDEMIAEMAERYPEGITCES